MAAVAVLKNQKERVPIDTLRLLTYHRNGGVRLAALKVLEAQITQIPVELLITLLSDEKKDVCRVALQLLKQVAPQVLSDLLPQATAALQGTPVGNVFGSLAQMHVADTLGELGITAPELLEALTALLNWPHWLVRIKAIEALGKLRRNIPDAAIKRLLELRRDPDPRMKAVREAADDALGETLSLEAGIEDE
jgi:HEAT repeat protein